MYISTYTSKQVLLPRIFSDTTRHNSPAISSVVYLRTPYPTFDYSTISSTKFVRFSVNVARLPYHCIRHYPCSTKLLVFLKVLLYAGAYDRLKLLSLSAIRQPIQENFRGALKIAKTLKVYPSESFPVYGTLVLGIDMPTNVSIMFINYQTFCR